MLLTKTLRILMAPEGRDDLPGFTNEEQGEAWENQRDESDILADQDVMKSSDLQNDENMGARSQSLDSLEDEPDPFLAGEIDVKEQMDRAADAMESSILGFQNQSTEDSPRTELGASFRDTPGGLEEVEMKTDQEMIQRRHPAPKWDGEHPQKH